MLLVEKYGASNIENIYKYFNCFGDENGLLVLYKIKILSHLAAYDSFKEIF